MKLNRFVSVVLLLGIPMWASAGISGKISGRVTDRETGEPLLGANVVVEGTSYGAVSDDQGRYFIINLPPGTYSVFCSYMGYKRMSRVNVGVSVDQTSLIDFKIQSEAVQMEAVVINADREVSIQKDLTSSLKKVKSSEIATLPVETVSDLIGLQAGVTVDNGGGIHIRGGRTTEVKYYMDGIAVSDPFNNSPAVNLENSMIQELEVISGTFNAEYGQAMSGIVNIVTKEGTKRFSGSLVASIGDFLSSHDETFYHIDDINPLSQQYYEGSLSGPLKLGGLNASFFLSGRMTNDENWLYGRRVFNITDYSDFRDTNPNKWQIQKTGDSTAVPMNFNNRNSLFGKLNWQFGTRNRFFYSLLHNQGRWKNYSHAYKMNPDYLGTYWNKSFNHVFKWTHVWNLSTFLEFSGNYLTTDFHHYKYAIDRDATEVEIPFGYYTLGLKRFNPANYFSTGGVDPYHVYRTSKTLGTTFSITSQINYTHQLKLGVEFRKHFLDFEDFSLQADAQTRFVPFIPPRSSVNHNQYTGEEKPEEFTAYFQDKIELNSLIMNLGVRFDYFHSRGKIPVDFRDPENDIFPIDSADAYTKVKPKTQISPRIGLAYPITDKGSIHASYGHFFQIPEFTRLFENPEFEITAGEFKSYIGNADLEAQRTTMYEIGLQQQLTPDIIVDVTGFFRDVRNLLGTRLYDTYIGSDRYGRYYNVDYGSVKGITISVEKHPLDGMFSGKLDYTYQTAMGNASDPREIFLLAQQKTQLPKRLVPLNWDQRHTFNASVSLSRPKWGISFIGNFHTGYPWTPLGDIELSNSQYQKSQYSLDMRAFIRRRFGPLQWTWFIQVENVLDTRRSDVLPEIDPYELISHNEAINTLYDYRYNVGREPMPRLVKTGFRLEM